MTTITAREGAIEGLEGVLRQKWPNPLSFNDSGDPFSFNEGEPCTLVIDDAQSIQARDFETKELLTWPSGDPMMILVLLGTEEKSGERASLFLQGAEITKAFHDARSTAQVTDVVRGDTVITTWTGTKPTEPKKGTKSRAKLSPTKLYECVYVPLG